MGVEIYSCGCIFLECEECNGKVSMKLKGTFRKRLVGYCKHGKKHETEPLTPEDITKIEGLLKKHNH